MGSVIVEEVVEALVALNLTHGHKLILAGSSAGGVGAMVNVDRVSHQLSDRGIEAEVRAISDSGWFLDNEPFAPLECRNAHSCPPVEAIRRGQQLWQGRVPNTCLQEYPHHPWYCYFGYKAYPTLKSPLFVFQWVFDEAQMTADNVGKPISKEQWDYIHGIGERLRKTFQNVTALFAPSCISHTILTKRDWANVKIGDVSLPQALYCWDVAPATSLSAKNAFRSGTSSLSVPTNNKEPNRTGRDSVDNLNGESDSENKTAGNPELEKPSDLVNLESARESATREMLADSPETIVSIPKSFLVESNAIEKPQVSEKRPKRKENKDNRDNGRTRKGRGVRKTKDIEGDRERSARSAFLPLHSKQSALHQTQPASAAVSLSLSNTALLSEILASPSVPIKSFSTLPPMATTKLLSQEDFPAALASSHLTLTSTIIPFTTHSGLQTNGEDGMAPNSKDSWISEMCPSHNLHLTDRCAWPHCNYACPKLLNPYTGEEMNLIDLLKSFGLDMASVANALGIDIHTLNSMGNDELQLILTH
ncbi:hypothetical protein SK128_017907 [Halocaridina rubra]|uniref:Notum n=1 Tax=Halocaridina rubra TaxID=373956 RepID=A0AAN8XCX6_HALRR